MPREDTAVTQAMENLQVGPAWNRNDAGHCLCTPDFRISFDCLSRALHAIQGALWDAQRAWWLSGEGGSEGSSRVDESGSAPMQCIQPKEGGERARDQQDHPERND
jgi:hypothetical protein